MYPSKAGLELRWSAIGCWPEQVASLLSSRRARVQSSQVDSTSVLSWINNSQPDQFPSSSTVSPADFFKGPACRKDDGGRRNAAAATGTSLLKRGMKEWNNSSRAASLNWCVTPKVCVFAELLWPGHKLVGSFLFIFFYSKSGHTPLKQFFSLSLFNKCVLWLFWRINKIYVATEKMEKVWLKFKKYVFY